MPLKFKFDLSVNENPKDKGITKEYGNDLQHLRRAWRMI
jgi:hypothetical protein